MKKFELLGFYRFKDKDKKGNDTYTYCYVTKDENGFLKYNFIRGKDRKEAIKTVVEFANSNGYSIEDLEDMFKDKKKFNFSCTSKEDVVKKVREAHNINNEEGKTITEKDAFDASYDKFKEKSEKTIKWPKGIKKIVVRAAIVATIVLTTFGGFKLFKGKGPTDNGSKFAITDEIDNLNDINKTAKNTDEEKKDDKNIEDDKTKDDSLNKIDNTSSKSSDSKNSSKTTKKSNNSNSGTSSNVTSTPGSVNSSYHEYQDPNQKLEDNTNSNNSGNSNNSETTDNKYDNVISSEEDTSSNDNDYSEEIDVSTDKDDNYTLDDRFEGNEGAVKPLPENNNQETAVDKDEPLPDQNETAVAGDGDYVTTEEELNNQNNEASNQMKEEVPVKQESSNESQTTQSSDTTTTNQPKEEVPVKQEPSNEPVSTNESTATPTNDQVVTQAIDLMSQGEDVNILYNQETGSMSLDTSNTTTTTDTNSMTK